MIQNFVYHKLLIMPFYYELPKKEKSLEQIFAEREKQLYSKIFQKKNIGNNNSSNLMDHEIVRSPFFSGKVVKTYGNCECTNALNLY